MKQSTIWLLALLSILTLAATSTLAIAEEDSAHLSGSMEVGATAVDTKDNPARVNEYSRYRPEDGLSFAPSLDLEYLNKGIWIEAEADVRGPKDLDYGLKADLNRVLRLDLDYQVFEHWKDHDTFVPRISGFSKRRVLAPIILAWVLSLRSSNLRRSSRLPCPTGLILPQIVVAPTRMTFTL